MKMFRSNQFQRELELPEEEDLQWQQKRCSEEWPKVRP